MAGGGRGGCVGCILSFVVNGNRNRNGSRDGGGNYDSSACYDRTLQENIVI